MGWWKDNAVAFVRLEPKRLQFLVVVRKGSPRVMHVRFVAHVGVDICAFALARSCIPVNDERL